MISKYNHGAKINAMFEYTFITSKYYEQDCNEITDRVGPSAWVLIYTCSCYILLDVSLINIARVQTFLFRGQRVV